METMRLQKFLARAGVDSRRNCETYITDGRVTVNGVCVTELGTQVDPSADVVLVDGTRVELDEAPVTLMLHKPAGYVTTMSDPQGRPCAADLIPLDRYPGLFHVGRLDRDTTGLLLFSSDGELANGLIHPRKHVWKRYVALVDGDVSDEQLAKLRSGVDLGGKATLPAEAVVLEGKDAREAAAQIGTGAQASGYAQRHAGKRGRRAREDACCYVSIRICEGRNRQVRKMFTAVGCEVIALHRCELGPLSLGDLPRGEWRLLTPEEIAALAAAAGM